MPATSQDSYVQGVQEPPLLDMTIGAALTAAASAWPERDALVSVAEGVRLSFRDLDAHVSALAAGLYALGLATGDRIGIWSPNNAGWALTQFAAARAGLVLVTINPAYRSEEVADCLRRLQVRALVAAEAFKGCDYAAMIDTLVASDRLPELEFRILISGRRRPGWRLLNEIPSLSDGEGQRLDAFGGVTARDPVNVQFTSGTTGMPKGATLTHHNILNNGALVGRCIGLGPGDRLCIPVPLYHCFGMVLGNLACSVPGAAMIYPGEGFSAQATLAAVAKEHCTHLYGVPTMFIALLAEPGVDTLNLSRLRGGIMAGAPCPPNVMRDVVRRLNMAQVTIAYGMTETSPVSFQTARDDGLEARTTTVGTIQPHLECKIVDGDGRIVSRGETGELCVRGYSVMAGYWCDPERTSEVIDAEGWMHTGDLATLDDAGYGRIVGRSKDVVIRGGENVYPQELERFLRTHPMVADAAVVGVPDERLGEEICAWVRLHSSQSLSAEELVTFCRGRIAHYKTPRYIRIVDDLPLTVTGKVKKFRIRDLMINEFSRGNMG